MAVTTPKIERSVLRIRVLNDAFRTTLLGGRVIVTQGIASLPVEVQTEVLKAVITFDAFTPDNDPRGEHDFGSFQLAGQTLFWKIDAFSKDDFRFGSPDPGDPDKTSLVLTIMLASEY